MKRFAEKPIELPGSPFWKVFKRFGRDEAIAMLVNVVGTAIVSLFSTSVLVLSIAGPVVEKIGFFPAHIWEAWKIYRTTPIKKRKPLRHYAKQAIKGGSVSLAEDVLIHDPLYIILMMAGFAIYPETPAWVLAAMSFIIAVVAVAGIEVGVTELRYWFFKRRAKKVGFKLERYYEARFFINAEADPDEIMSIATEEFGLETQQLLTYYDRYFDAKLPNYSGRGAKIRFRRRTNPDAPGEMEGKPAGSHYTAQIVYTRAMEATSGKVEQCRFFPIAKEKLYWMYFPESDEEAGSLPDVWANNFLKGIHGGETHALNFIRYVAFNKDILVSADRVRGDRDYYLLELKTHKNLRVLMRAMRFVMQEFPVVQTTHSKAEICE